jgi:hypothetical protein
MKLKTCHGTYVVVGKAGELLHLPAPADKDFKTVWSEGPPPEPAPGLYEVEIVTGPLAPSTMEVLADGFVAIRRDELYLCAVPGLSELRFEAQLVGPWERLAITGLDGNFVSQTVQSHVNPDAQWFETHGVDFAVASRPAGGQAFTIWGSDPNRTISYIGIQPAGRFGNNLYQIINAYWLAKSLNLETLVLSKFDFVSENTSYGVDIKPASNFRNFKALGLRGNFFVPSGFEKFFRLGLRSDEELLRVIKMLGATYKTLVEGASSKRSIALHFRSGDIFIDSGHPFYVQPPASYYLKCFDHAQESATYDIVELIYEDRKNPAIEIVENALSARGIEFESRATSLEGDINRLLSADCIISSFGTFAEAAGLISKYLKSYYCFRSPSSQEFWHPFSQTWVASLMSIKDVDLYICDEIEPIYMTPRSWSNSEAQNELIRSYSQNYLRLYKY